MTFSERKTDRSHCLCIRREIDDRTWTIYSGELVGKNRAIIGDPLLSMDDVSEIIRLLKFLESNLGVSVLKIPSPPRLTRRKFDAHAYR